MNSSSGCLLGTDLEHPKELCELYNDYVIPPNKI